jgi:hypothetical protein
MRVDLWGFLWAFEKQEVRVAGVIWIRRSLVDRPDVIRHGKGGFVVVTWSPCTSRIANNPYFAYGRVWSVEGYSTTNMVHWW